MSRHPSAPGRRRAGLGTAIALTALVAAPHALAQTSDDTAGENTQLPTMVVSASRAETPVSEVARSVTVVTAEDIREQVAFDRNLGDILANTVPGLGPSTEAISNFGQSLRGRNFLVLIDGVPQSTPLRDGFRDLNNIDPSAIERIEVVRGGTAVYGFGAQGGLVNIITKKAVDTPVEGYSRAGASISTEHADDSLIFETAHRVSGTSGNVDYVAAGSFVTRNGRFDADGRWIPPNPLGSQGGFSDTDQFDLLGKFGYSFDGGSQRIGLTVNHFNVEQDTDFTFGAAPFTLPEDPTPDSPRTPAIPKEEAVGDTAALVDAGTENTVVHLDYTNLDALGGTINVKGYYGDQAVTFPRFPGFPQGTINSEKAGARLTANTPLNFNGNQGGGGALTWGADYLHDETDAERFGDNAVNGVPDMEQDAIAGFAELEWSLGGVGLLRGGIRHEVISVETDTVTNPLGNTVLGDELDFDETLFNASAVFYLGDSLDLFASFSQGFSIADIGRVIRDAGPFEEDVTFRAGEFESEAEKVDNFELGFRGGRGPFNFELAGFYSDSDNGTTFDSTAPDDVRIQKFSEEIWGLEGSLDVNVTDRLQLGTSVSWSEGVRDSGSGDEVDLDNTRISPVKITGFAEYSPRQWWHNRVQVLYVGDRSVDIGRETGFASGDVDNYALVDLTSRVRAGPGWVRVSLQNLFNNDYFPAINQAFNTSSAFAKGPGRRIGVGYEVDWR